MKHRKGIKRIQKRYDWQLSPPMRYRPFHQVPSELRIKINPKLNPKLHSPLLFFPCKTQGQQHTVTPLFFAKAVQHYLTLAQTPQKLRHLTFRDLCFIAINIHRLATSERSLYFHEFSNEIFKCIVAKILSNDDEVLQTAPEKLAMILFQPLVDPVRYYRQLKQCAVKILDLIYPVHLPLNNISTLSALWKLALLAELNRGDYIQQSRFREIENAITPLQSKVIQKTQPSVVQHAFTHQLKTMLTKEAKSNLKIEYPIGPYVTDIAFPNYKLVIEFDGMTWHHRNLGQQHRDQLKDFLLQEYDGWTIVHIPAVEYRKHQEANLTEQYIQHKLREFPSLFSAQEDSQHEIVEQYYKPRKPRYRFREQEQQEERERRHRDRQIKEAIKASRDKNALRLKP